MKSNKLRNQNWEMPNSWQWTKHIQQILTYFQAPYWGILPPYTTSAHDWLSQKLLSCCHVPFLFAGSEIVDWLLRWSLVRNRENGAAMAQTLLKLGHLQQVCLRDGSTVSPKFSDTDKLYRFVSSVLCSLCAWTLWTLVFVKGVCMCVGVGACVCVCVDMDCRS